MVATLSREAANVREMQFAVLGPPEEGQAVVIERTKPVKENKVMKSDVYENNDLAIPSSESQATPELDAAPAESVAFAAGRKARAMKIPLRQSALRVIRPGSRQYDDYIDGYDYESAQRRRKPKTAKS